MNTFWKILAGIGAVVVILFASAIGKLVGKSAVDSYYSGKQEGITDEVLLKTANDLNAKLPMMVDSETRLDSSVGLHHSFRYNYTLVNYTSFDISAADLRDAMEQKLINSVCTTTEMQVFIKNGVTVSYAYYGSDGRQISVISVSPAQCGGV